MADNVKQYGKIRRFGKWLEKMKHSQIIYLLIILFYYIYSINGEEGGFRVEHKKERHRQKSLENLLEDLRNSKVLENEEGVPLLPYEDVYHAKRHNKRMLDESQTRDKYVGEQTPRKTKNLEYTDGSSICPNCLFDHVDYQKNDGLRLQAIKYQILSKLGLKEKPNVTLPIPREVLFETLSRADDYKGTDNLLWFGDTNKKEEEKVDEEELLESEPDDFYGRTSEIITFAEPGQILNGQSLLEFIHSSESEPGVAISQLRVKSAVLWVRVTLKRSQYRPFKASDKNMTLWVFKVKPGVCNVTVLSGKEFDEYTEMVASLSVSPNHLGWQKFDLTLVVKEWYGGTGRKDRLRLLLDCSGCKDLVEPIIFQPTSQQHYIPGDSRPSSYVYNTGNRDTSERNVKSELLNRTRVVGSRRKRTIRYQNPQKMDPNRPFLVVHTEPIVMRRSRRRALDCSGAIKGQCCKQSFFVSFKDLKWDDWIIAPKGYHANYCRGDCGGVHRTPDTFLNYHTHVLEEYRKMDRLSGIQPCCAPLKFSSMSLIYFGPDNNIIKRDLPKMVVEQCGCP